MDSKEHQVNFLIQASAAASLIQNKQTQQILRNIYLTHCKQVIGITKLPQKHFSKEIRCPRCSLELTKDTESRVNPIKLSKRQRRRIRFNAKAKKKSGNKEYLLHSTNLEKVCSFCSHATKTPILKPSKDNTSTHIEEEKTSVANHKIPEKVAKKVTIQKKDNYQTNVYCQSKEVFSLNAKNNTLKSHIKEPPKIIKNNKKKKDKFAGLCQAAVLAASKLKQQKDKQNILNLFLKPSN